MNDPGCDDKIVLAMCFRSVRVQVACDVGATGCSGFSGVRTRREREVDDVEKQVRY